MSNIKNKKIGLTIEDFENADILFEKATNKQLYLLLEKLEHEIKLSESCIKEGFEERG